MRNQKRLITLCSSASFYEEVLKISSKLRKLGFRTLVPLTAHVMKRRGDFDVSHYKTWETDASAYRRKKYLMMAHFEKIDKADAILVVNLEKKGVKGYIGPNALMEMGLALWQKKPIFLYNPPTPNSPFTEEIIGMFPIILNRDLSKISKACFSPSSK